MQDDSSQREKGLPDPEIILMKSGDFDEPFQIHSDQQKRGQAEVSQHFFSNIQNEYPLASKVKEEEAALESSQISDMPQLMNLNDQDSYQCNLIQKHWQMNSGNGNGSMNSNNSLDSHLSFQNLQGKFNIHEKAKNIVTSFFKQESIDAKSGHQKIGVRTLAASKNESQEFQVKCNEKEDFLTKNIKSSLEEIIEISSYKGSQIETSQGINNSTKEDNSRESRDEQKSKLFSFFQNAPQAISKAFSNINKQFAQKMQIQNNVNHDKQQENLSNQVTTQKDQINDSINIQQSQKKEIKDFTNISIIIDPQKTNIVQNKPEIKNDEKQKEESMKNSGKNEKKYLETNTKRSKGFKKDEKGSNCLKIKEFKMQDYQNGESQGKSFLSNRKKSYDLCSSYFTELQLFKEQQGAQPNELSNGLSQREIKYYNFYHSPFQSTVNWKKQNKSERQIGMQQNNIDKEDLKNLSQICIKITSFSQKSKRPLSQKSRFEDINSNNQTKDQFYDSKMMKTSFYTQNNQRNQNFKKSKTPIRTVTSQGFRNSLESSQQLQTLPNSVKYTRFSMKGEQQNPDYQILLPEFIVPIQSNQLNFSQKTSPERRKKIEQKKQFTESSYNITDISEDFSSFLYPKLSWNSQNLQKFSRTQYSSQNHKKVVPQQFIHSQQPNVKRTENQASFNRFTLSNTRKKKNNPFVENHSKELNKSQDLSHIQVLGNNSDFINPINDNFLIKKALIFQKQAFSVQRSSQK